jgi:hypothetical protein
MFTKGNEQVLDLVCKNDQTRPALSPELQKLEQHQWYSDIIYFLSNLTCPSHLIGHKRRDLRLKASKYCIIQDDLGWKNLNGVILRCVDELESKIRLVDSHSRFYCGHFAAKTTAHKILRAGYYWSTIFSYVHKMVRSC